MDRPIRTEQTATNFVAIHTERGAAQRGYPTTKVQWGARTIEDMLEGVDMGEVVETKRVAKAAVIRIYGDGTLVYRLHKTDIVTKAANGTWIINTGGWNTVTTRRHITDFLSLHGFAATLWGNKKAGGNILRDLRDYQGTAREMKFEKTLVIFPNGEWRDVS